MFTKTVQITEVTVDELADAVADKLMFKIENYLKELSKKQNDEILTRQEVADYLRISLVTIHSWNKHGILNPIRMGNRIFYKKQDILDVLEQQKINKKR
ncbi:helix-turn-helix domain-containing protein [Tamlana crocina]|uniref:Helix-turn-helix domain-containing protein n=1 Tax=Tamlana crocina TaxID=393006 RepID=A0ABX1DEQ7_9FLAO|nr:helix-turn-helix domain-containing protein [Tamlana crocina]MBR9847650.1 helix-turn-helix domain-containing protein [Algicola sp.]NJX16825.1 helix-turn-helix domain-containing protein [Tamlana crocina]